MAEFIQLIETKRFLEVLDELIIKQIVNNDSDFCRKIGYAAQSLSHIRKGKRDVTIELIGKICTVFNSSPLYIFRGEGEKILVLQDRIDIYEKEKENLIRDLIQQNEALNKIVELHASSATTNFKYIKMLEEQLKLLKGEYDLIKG